MDEYKKTIKKMYFVELVVNDVFSRLYHQLSHQDKLVIKDFVPNRTMVHSAIINAVLESLFQRGTFDAEDEKAICDAVVDAWSDREVLSDTEDIDFFNDVKAIVSLIRSVCEIAVYALDDKQFGKIEDFNNKKIRKALGDLNEQPIFVDNRYSF